MRSIIDERPRQRRIGGLSMPNYSVLIKDWNSFFSSIFGETITDTIGWFSRPRALVSGIVVPKWMTLELLFSVFDSCRIPIRNGLGSGPEYALTHRRDPARHGSYIVWHVGKEFPDDDLIGVRGLELIEHGIETLTLIEYLLFHLHYFVRHQWMLRPDRRNLESGVVPKILCAGTENARGNIPLAYDDNGTLALTIIHPYPDHPDAFTGSRRVYADPRVFGTNYL